MKINERIQKEKKMIYYFLTYLKKNFDIFYFYFPKFSLQELILFLIAYLKKASNTYLRYFCEKNHF